MSITNAYELHLHKVEETLRCLALKTMQVVHIVYTTVFVEVRSLEIRYIMHIVHEHACTMSCTCKYVHIDA